MNKHRRPVPPQSHQHSAFEIVGRNAVPSGLARNLFPSPLLIDAEPNRPAEGSLVLRSKSKSHSERKETAYRQMRSLHDYSSSVTSPSLQSIVKRNTRVPANPPATRNQPSHGTAQSHSVPGTKYRLHKDPVPQLPLPLRNSRTGSEASLFQQRFQRRAEGYCSSIMGRLLKISTSTTSKLALENIKSARTHGDPPRFD